MNIYYPKEVAAGHIVGQRVISIRNPSRHTKTTTQVI